MELVLITLGCGVVSDNHSETHQNVINICIGGRSTKYLLPHRGVKTMFLIEIHQSNSKISVAREPWYSSLRVVTAGSLRVLRRVSDALGMSSRVLSVIGWGFLVTANCSWLQVFCVELVLRRNHVFNN